MYLGWYPKEENIGRRQVQDERKWIPHRPLQPKIRDQDNEGYKVLRSCLCFQKCEDLLQHFFWSFIYYFLLKYNGILVSGMQCDNLMSLKDFCYLFSERGREGKRERNITVWVPLTCPLLGTWPTTQVCASIPEINTYFVLIDWQVYCGIIDSK